MTTPKKEINFTARDFELLAKAMTCTREPMNIDYNKLAEAGPFKNSNSAKASWHGLKKKIDALAEGAPLKGATSTTEGDGSITTAKTPSKKRKAEPAKAQEDDEAEDDAEGTPAKKTSKKARKPSAKGKGKAEVMSEASDAEDGEQSQAVQEDAQQDADAAAGAVKSEPSDV